MFHEDSPDRIYVITSRVIHIGRDYDVDIRLLSESVSARHARIVNLGTAFEVEDLNSTNGTFVRGNRVAKTTLKSGDRLTVGTVGMMFLLEPPTAATMRVADLKRRPTLVTASPGALWQPPPPRAPELAPARVIRHQDAEMSLGDAVRHVAAAYRFLRRRALLIAMLVLLGVFAGVGSYFALPPSAGASSEVKLQPRSLLPGQGDERWQNVDEGSGAFVRESEHMFARPDLVRATLLKLSIPDPSPQQIAATIGGMKVEEIGDHLLRITYKDRSRSALPPVEFLTLHLRAFVQAEITKSVRELKAKVDFLGDQLASVEADMTRAGEQRARFREQNADRLPEEAPLAQSNRHVLEARRADLLTSINQLEGQLRSEKGQMQEGSPLARTKFQSSETYRQALADVNRRLSEAYAGGFADGHPEVMRLRDERQRLQALAKDELQSETSTLQRDSDPNYQLTRHQIDKLEADLSAARTNLAETDRTLARLREVEHDLPRVEQQLSELDHRQAATKQLHGELFAKLKQAEIQLNLEKVSAESRYDITPPALERPRRSTALAIRGTVGLFCGLFLAAMLIALREGRRLLAQALAPLPVSLTSIRAANSQFRDPRS